MQYERVFGGELTVSDFPLLVKRALKYGASLWVSRAAHYTNITDKSTLTAKSAAVDVTNDSTIPPNIKNVLKIKTSSHGTWGNNLQVRITASNIDPENAFTIAIIKNGKQVEILEDMTMSVSSDKYIGNSGSSYLEIDVINTALPKAGTYMLSGGIDGTDGMSDADYIGRAANTTGIHVFDDITDAIQLAVPGVSSPAVITAGNAYCEARGDMIFISETPFNLTPQEAVNFRLGTGAYNYSAFSTNYGAMYYPKIKIYDVARQKERYISPVGDVLGVMAVNDFSANESYVPAGTRRGRILNALGVDVNVGGRGRLSDGNYLCENQINPVCAFYDTGVVVWGAQTLQRKSNLMRELNVRRMLLVVSKLVRQ